MTKKKTLNPEDISSERGMTRRSALRTMGTGVLGAAAVTAGMALRPEVAEATTDSDSGPGADLSGSGTTDSDSGPNADHGGAGRGCNDSDSGPNSDPTGRGRSCQ
jgi:hypothetical protein